MRRYLLDTGPLSAFLFDRRAAVELISPWIQSREATTSILAYGEIAEYLRGQISYPQRLRDLRALLREVTPHFLTYRIVERYADVRRRLRPPHGPGLIGDVDTLIAATAIERNLTLVTMDRDFQRVPDLSIMLIDR